jgi:hypothetical protein
VALYNDLPVFKDVYQLTLRIFELTMGFAREFKHSPQVDNQIQFHHQYAKLDDLTGR